MSGKLIVIEGIDGSGKSTQFKLLSQRLEQEGIEFRHVVFPQYSEPSSTLIKMYLNGEFGSDPDAVNAYAASTFFAVDRFASYAKDWKEYYLGGGLILCDRYTTSNALHQGAKLGEEERKEYYSWLYDFEFRLMGLPKPDAVFYMNIPLELALKNMALRQSETGTSGDIHETHSEYLSKCIAAASQAVEHYGWDAITCADENGAMRALEDISNELYEKVKKLI